LSPPRSYNSGKVLTGNPDIPAVLKGLKLLSSALSALLKTSEMSLGQEKISKTLFINNFDLTQLSLIARLTELEVHLRIGGIQPDNLCENHNKHFQRLMPAFYKFHKYLVGFAAYHTPHNIGILVEQLLGRFKLLGR